MKTSKKRLGRFIKNTDPIKKVLNITDYSLMDICESPYTSVDNANSNIIHERLHSEDELLLGVRNSQEIETVFPPAEERLVIRPLDFTEERRRQKKRQANRQQRTEDDEDFDPFQMQKTADQDDEVASKAKQPEKVQAKPLEVEMTAPTRASILDRDFGAPPAAAAAAKEPIKASAPSAPEPQRSPAPERPAARAPTPAPSPAPAPIPAPAADDSFMPYYEAGSPMAVERPSEEELQAIREAARNEGYRQGYKLGEEKATLESRQKVQAILAEIGNIIGELQGMQKSILGHVQDNFQAICQSLIESLLHKEFRINPEAFSIIIERAISEAIPEDEYKVFVSPTVAHELDSWQNKNLKQHIRRDESLQGFHFRIEGKHASVDADLHKIIGELLDQADLSLFEDREKAS